jgi:hypothetical protein
MLFLNERNDTDSVTPTMRDDVEQMKHGFGKFPENFQNELGRNPLS